MLGAWVDIKVLWMILTKSGCLKLVEKYKCFSVRKWNII